MNPTLGRPPIDNPRTRTAVARLTDDEYATLAAAASKAGLPLGVWMRQRLLAAAKRAR
jgi:hypothetical protein